MEIVFALGAAMAVGLLLNRIVKKVGLPNVTAYLIAGILVGPYVFNIFSSEMLEPVSLITTVALGFIAFSIGGEFNFNHIKAIGSSVITIALFQALTAVLFVDVALIVAGFPVPLALILGAIATATAPAATLMVVRQYKADGPVTRMLLPVVALDDAVGLIVFSISLSLASSMVSATSITVYTALVEPLLEIVLSLLVGGVIGIVLSFCFRLFMSRANRICLITAAVFLGVALADKFHLSSLLLCMAIGAAVANLRNDAEKLLELNDRWTPPLFLLFFVISGAELDLAVLPTIGLLGVLYLIFRSLGKYLGAMVGSAAVKADKNIVKYLGVALLPQAGVAIGMSQIISNEMPIYGDTVRTVVLCATLIYEIFGPVLTKIVLIKAGEIKKEPKKTKEKASV